MTQYIISNKEHDETEKYILFQFLTVILNLLMSYSLVMILLVQHTNGRLYSSKDYDAKSPIEDKMQPFTSTRLMPLNISLYSK